MRDIGCQITEYMQQFNSPDCLVKSPVIAVNHKDEALSVLEVMSPQRTDFVLTTHIPDSETDVLVFNSLNVKPWKTILRARSWICLHFCTHRW